MCVVHIVMYEFKPLVTPEEIDGVCNRMLALKDRCLHPQTKVPYIRRSMGGADTSPEELQDGSTHVFVCEFDTPEDRRYYLEEDPEYSAFAASIEGLVERKRVVDFEPGEFSSRMR